MYTKKQNFHSFGLRLFRPIILATFLFVFFSACSKDTGNLDNDTNNPGVISFSGYQWIVRSTGESKSGPGPNYFSNSEENVWLDNAGKLHMRITNDYGVWYCSEVTLLESLGYGHYLFQIESRVDLLDKNIIAALFLYRNDTQEIDIEFAKWGNATADNAQFVIQPSATYGNKERFDLQMNQKTITGIINWQQEAITFSVYAGAVDRPDESKLIKKWTYTGSDIPKQSSDPAAKINFWLMDGIAPSNQSESELVISKFKYF